MLTQTWTWTLGYRRRPGLHHKILPRTTSVFWTRILASTCWERSRRVTSRETALVPSKPMRFRSKTQRTQTRYKYDLVEREIADSLLVSWGGEQMISYQLSLAPALQAFLCARTANCELTTRPGVGRAVGATLLKTQSTLSQLVHGELVSRCSALGRGGRRAQVKHEARTRSSGCRAEALSGRRLVCPLAAPPPSLTPRCCRRASSTTRALRATASRARKTTCYPMS